ncbi:MAG: epoxyqueuosine reductase [Desulfosoma sp.]|uniref:epoxyqueuosine reductase n=1 Tax=Desulfosoma sp. TaxID=2603217 RepID=UPI00404AAB21
MRTRLQQIIEGSMRAWADRHGGKAYWRLPACVGIAHVQDPLFGKLRKIAAPDHALPHDLLSCAASVIVFFLPFRKDLAKENRQVTPYAARSWAEAYVATNALIAEICEALKHHLAQEGYESVVTPATHNFDEKRLLSRWSHKHLGYIAGLGTFGIHHQLITHQGACGRLGSLVTAKPMEPTPRPTVEYCLVKSGHACTACVHRCTFGALTFNGLDRHRCYAQLLENDRRFKDLPLVDVCGKCVADVPCSYGIPKSSMADCR